MCACITWASLFEPGDKCEVGSRIELLLNSGHEEKTTPSASAALATPITFYINMSCSWIADYLAPWSEVHFLDAAESEARILASCGLCVIF